MRKAFKCTIVTDQQVLASSTLPSAMKERYQSCDKPPRLQEMNPYRDDNKDALKFYTDPTYFFELWCEEMRKETEKKKRKRVSTSDFFSIWNIKYWFLFSFFLERNTGYNFLVYLA